ncbi:unnamed protein product [Durusdinium trenchii]|uniref:Uncharacterized protein n=1 Tax=Durusdinium trenchii TaxID=1381693 RepID=A0ABP0Q6A5_9DINO
MFLAFVILATAEAEPPWLGRFRKESTLPSAGSLAVPSETGLDLAELVQKESDLWQLPELPEVQKRLDFDGAQLNTCNLEEADAFWETHPFRKTTKTRQQIQAMRAIKEFKRLLPHLPLILVGDSLLGWRRGCFLSPRANRPVEVATFGSWVDDYGLDNLEEALQAEGHQLDQSECLQGPLMAGCRLRAKLKDSSSGATATIRLGMLLSPPPVAQHPGLFPRCLAACGDSCERCVLAWAVEAPGGRFFACPLPLAGFKVATWMNESFWMPKDVDLYLEFEYGRNWPEPGDFAQGPLASCEPAQSAGFSFSKYPTFISSLPQRKELIRLEQAIGRTHAAQVMETYEAERHLWQRFFDTRSMAWPLRHSRPMTKNKRHLGHQRPSTEGSWSVVVVILLLFLVAFLVRHSSRWRNLFRKALAVPRSAPWRSANLRWALEVNSVEVILLESYVFLSVARISFQSAGSSSGSPWSHALAASMIQAGVALGLLALLPGSDLPWESLHKPCPKSFGPIWFWTLLAGALQSASLWLSFVSLTSLDSLSYALFWSNEAFLTHLLPTRARGLCLLAAAASALGTAATAPAAAALGAAALGALGDAASEAAAGPRNQLLRTCQHCQGFAVLLAVVMLWKGEVFPANYWASFLESRSLPACVACLCILNLGKPYFTQKVSPTLLALGTSITIIAIAILQRCSGALAKPTWQEVAQVILSLVAAGLHALDLAQAPAKAKVVKAPKTMTPSSKAAVARPKAKSILEPRVMKRPPFPLPPRKWTSTTSSEVGSTMASSGHSDAADSEGDGI